MFEDGLNSLLLTWQEQQSQGRDVQAAELCRDCPELADELDHLIQVMRQMNALLQPDRIPSGAADSSDATFTPATGSVQTNFADGAGLAWKNGQVGPEPIPVSIPGYEI